LTSGPFLPPKNSPADRPLTFHVDLRPNKEKRFRTSCARPTASPFRHRFPEPLRPLEGTRGENHAYRVSPDGACPFFSDGTSVRLLRKPALYVQLFGPVSRFPAPLPSVRCLYPINKAAAGKPERLMPPPRKNLAQGSSLWPVRGLDDFRPSRFHPP